MVIGIDASRANREKRTGVEQYAYFVIEEMKKRGNKEIEVVLYTDQPLKGDLANLPSGWTQKVLRWPPRRFWTQIRLSLEMFFHPPDVLFIPAHVFPLIHPKKTVMTIHDVAALRFPESYNWFERWYSLWSGRFAVKHLWKVIVPSEFTKRELQHIDTTTLQHNNITVIPLAYDSTRYKRKEPDQDNAGVLQKYGITKPFLLTIGRLEEKKNTARIIEAFNEVRSTFGPLQLVLIGKPGHGYDRVQEALEKSPYKTDISTPGYVDENDAPRILQEASVFVFSSLYEGFGIPVLEALASGIPVIASKGSSLEEVGGDAAVFVDPLTSTSLVTAIYFFLQNKKLQEKKIQQGFEQVKKFSWGTCAQETIKVLTT